jgi:hypothetical protein
VIVYISIGNSDDKLSQDEWASFWAQTNSMIADTADEMHGIWMSSPNSPYQNACWCVELDEDMLDRDKNERLLRIGLAGLAKAYKQDSIAWAEVKETEFIK